MRVISVDIGATSGRVRVVKEEHGILSYEEIRRFSNHTYRDKNGSLRWDFSFLFSNVVDGIKNALRKYPDVASVGIDTWGVDYGLLDKEGKLIQDPLCYRDEKSIQSQKELLKKITYLDIYSVTGIQNRHFNTIYQLYQEKTDFKDVSTLLLIPDLIAYLLTGEKRREETNASTTALYDQKEKKISSGLLSQIGVPESIFPRRIYPGEVYGVRKKAFLPKDRNRSLPVLAVCTHDTGSAVLGANGKYPFAYLSSGTWSLLGTEIKTPIKNEDTYKANFTNEIGYGSSIRFLKNTMGRFLINETRKDYEKKGILISVPEIKDLVLKAGDMDSYLDVDDPLFETPGDRLRKIDSYLEKTSQKKPSSPGERRKRIYVSMALAYKTIFDKLLALTGQELDSLLIVGGGNQASVLNQYTANSLARRVVTGSNESTVLGNSVCQFLHHGVYKNRVEARKAIGRSIDSQVFYPEDVEDWKQKYESYQKVIHKGE